MSSTPARPLRARLVERAAVVAALFGAWFAWSLARHPQHYADDWYARGGLRRTVQIVATDVLGPTGVILAALISAFLYVGPIRIAAACRRAVTPPFSQSTRRALAALAILASLAAFAQPSIPRAAGAATDKPNVLLLVVDSFRADRLDARVTPNLVKLAARGTRFDRAYASGIPSSWMTGYWARGGTYPTLPEQFAQAGYAVTSMNDDVEEAVRSAGRRPFFATAFFSAPRFPYASPAPYYERYTDRAYRGRFKYDAGRDARASLDDADARQVGALYDGAVASVDDAVGRIWESLERYALAERTILVVVGEHGEMLFDAKHGSDARTHVPLLVVDGRTQRAGNRESAIVRDVDLAPTLYELAAITPPPNLDGRSFVRALHGEAIEPRFAFSESAEQTPVMRQRTIRDERFKLVYTPTRTSPQYALFDTAFDPAEQHDVGSIHPAVIARLQDALWSWMLADPTMEKRDGHLLPKDPPPPFTKVVWIAVDGLRSDVTATPAIDALARRGARFTEAYSSATPSTADKLAMLSGETIPRLLEKKGIPFDFVSYSVHRDGLAKVDQHIGELALDDKAVVILTGSDDKASVPIVVIAPGVIDPNVSISSRVRSIDIAPTLLDLVHIEKPMEMRGASLLPLARRLPDPERVILTEGRGSRALLHGPWRLVVRDKTAELFHVLDDPKQQRDLAVAEPAVLAEMKARLEAAVANVPVTSAEVPKDIPTALVRLRFLGGGAAHRVSGTVHVGDSKRSTNSYEVRLVDLGPETLRGRGYRRPDSDAPDDDERGKLDVAFRTNGDRAVGFDIIVDPPGAPITWDLWLDDGPWPDQGVFAGRFGLFATELRRGITTDDARAKAQAWPVGAFPSIDPRHDLGLFVTRELRHE